MNSRNHWFRLQAACAFLLICFAVFIGAADLGSAQAADATPVNLGPSFEQQVKPFLKQNCVRCHNTETAMSGVRVDQLDGALEDRHLKLWEAIRKRVGEESMPPKGQPQPTAA